MRIKIKPKKIKKDNLLISVSVFVFFVIIFAGIVYKNHGYTRQALGLENEVVDLGTKQALTVSKLPNQALALETCQDNDEGLNFEVQSTVSIYSDQTILRSYKDYCQANGSNVVVEYTCQNNQPQMGYHYCPNGCVSGACKPTPGKGTIYVVHAVDTEEMGLDPTKQVNTLDLSNYGPGSDVEYVFSEPYRNANRDSFGGKIKLSWFLMNDEAYCRSTQGDCNIIHTTMQLFAQKAKAYGDVYGWHYHHQDWSDLNNDSIFFWNQLLTFNQASYSHGTDVELAEKMVASQILDQQFYPSLLRMGWIWENTDFSNWLDDVLPYDFSNFSPLYHGQSSVDGIGNVYDWRRSLSDWSAYHPNSADYQLPGNLKRQVFKCGGSLADIFQAFSRANQGQDVLICTYIHSNYYYFERYSLLNSLRDANQRYPEVKFKFVNATEGIHIMQNIIDEQAPSANINRQGEIYTLITNEPLFTYPFGAVKKTDGSYARVKPQSLEPVISGTSQSWTFNLASLGYSEFAIGGSDQSGNTFVTHKYLN